MHARDERMLLEKALEGASWPWPFHWAEGGETRSDSVRAGLTLATGLGAEAVAVHDAARPLVTEALVTRVVARAQSAGAAIPGLPVADTLKRVVRGTDLVVETVSRTELWAVQTPQVVRVSLLQEAYATAARLGITGTDEASLLEAAGFEVAVVPGDPGNVKVTGPGDLALVDALGVRLGRWSAPPDSGPTP